MTSAMTWKEMPDADRIRQICTMIEDGRSSSFIAREMGTTRGAICGFCHRKGISLTGLQGAPKAPVKRKPGQRAKKPSSIPPAPAATPVDQPATEPAPTLAEHEAPAALLEEQHPAPAAEIHPPVHFLERTTMQCTRALWGRSWPGIEAAFVCGAPSLRPNGVCRDCAAILHTTPEKQKAASKKHKARVRKQTGRQALLGLVA